MIASRSIAVLLAGLLPGLAFGWLVSGRAEKTMAPPALSLLPPAPAEVAAVASAPSLKPPENAAATAPHKPVAVGMPEFDAVLNEVLSMNDFIERRVRAREILSGASLEQLPAIYDAVSKIPSWQTQFLFHAIGERWAELDLRGAVQFGLDRQRMGGSNPFLSEAESQWMERSPAEAAAWVQSLPPGNRRNRLMRDLASTLAGSDPRMAVQYLRQQRSYDAHDTAPGLFSSWANRDPNAAAAAALQLGGDLGQIAVESVAKSWGKKDPSSSLAWAASIPSASRRKKLVGAIAEQWAKSDPAKELEWARNQTDPETRRAAIDKGLGSLAAANHAGASEQINAMPEGEERNRAVRGAAFAAADTDARRGLQLLASLPASLDRTAAVSDICSVWGRKEPQAALDWLIKNAPASVDGDGLRTIMRGWAGSAPDQAVAWAQALPAGDNRNCAMAALVCGLTASDVTRAQSIFQQLSPDAQKLAVPAIASGLTQQGADKARAWAESLSVGPAQNDAFGLVACSWSNQNPTAAAQWLGTLSPGNARDAAVAGFVGPAFDRDPEGSMAWVQTISEPRERDFQTERLVRRWLTTDSQAARAWLEGNPQITPEERSRILEY